MTDAVSQMLRPGGMHLEPEAYQDLVELLPDGIVVIGPHGRLEMANDRATQLTGIALADHIGQPASRTLRLFDTAGANWWDAHGLRALQRGAPDLRESRAATAGGRTLLLTTRPLHRDDGSLRLLVISMRDTSERDRIEAETSALISTAAHELRSPLSSVRGFSQTLQRRWDALRDDQKRWMLGAIESDAERLSRMVAELLDISRLDTGRLVLARRSVDLAALVTSRIDRLVRRGQSEQRFAVVEDGIDEQVWADPDRLTQVVDNLLENAIRHGRGHITARLHHACQQIHLDVSDEGPGIPQDARSLVFSRFWQGDTRRKTGTGLGLYVVQGLVAAHGGTVEVLDRSQGATLRVSLPAGLPEHLR